MGSVTKQLLVILFAVGIGAVPFFGGQAKQNGITVAGTTEGNTGCMILAKHTPVKGKLLLAGVVYARTEYRVLRTFNYKPEKQKFTGPGAVNKLNRQAVKDKVKLVVVPSKYTPEQLEDARKLCGK